MRARVGISVGAAIAVAGALALPLGVGVAAADDCLNGGVVVVAGTSDPTSAAMKGVEQRYSGLGPTDKPGGPYKDAPWKVIHAEYPTTLWPVGSVGYNDDVSRAKTATQQAIVEYQTACPGKPVTVVGYSMGARAAGDVLNEVANGETVEKDGVTYKKVTGDDGTTYLIRQDRLSGELYSDPRRDGPESGRGIEQSMIGVIPGLIMTGARTGGFGTIPVISYCIEGDPICDLADPLHDPFGAIDGLVGYFTKHGNYPWKMFTPVGNWDCADPTASATGYVDCVVPQPSAISLLRAGLINQFRGAIGLAPREVTDLWSMLPNANAIFPHANLADLQRYITPVLELFPELPELGFGGHLPDLAMGQMFVEGLTTLDFAKMAASIGALGASLLSIAMMPVRAGQQLMARLALGVGDVVSRTAADSRASQSDSGAGLTSLRQLSRNDDVEDSPAKIEVLSEVATEPEPAKPSMRELEIRPFSLDNGQSRNPETPNTGMSNTGMSNTGMSNTGMSETTQPPTPHQLNTVSPQPTDESSPLVGVNTAESTDSAPQTTRERELELSAH